MCNPKNAGRVSRIRRADMDLALHTNGGSMIRTNQKQKAFAWLASGLCGLYARPVRGSFARGVAFG